MTVRVNKKDIQQNLAGMGCAANAPRNSSVAPLQDNRQSTVLQQKQIQALNNAPAKQQRAKPALQMKNGAPLHYQQTIGPIQLTAMPPANAKKRLSPIKNNSNTVQLLGWTSLGYLNPKRYLPEGKGGYTKDEMKQPDKRLKGGPLTALGSLNPRLYLPEKVFGIKSGGYTKDQMMEPQNYVTGPLSKLGPLNPRLYLPEKLGRLKTGGYTKEQMTENWCAGNKRQPSKGPNPLAALSKDKWWRLFIDKPLHADAEKEHMGMMFDRQKSPGYNRSMMEAFQKAIIEDRGKKVDYERYTQYHDLVSKYVEKKPSGKQTDSKVDEVDKMRQLGGREATSFFEVPGLPKPESKDEKLLGEPVIKERQAALDEMKQETVHGRTLVAPYDKDKKDSMVTAYSNMTSDNAKPKGEMRPQYPVMDGRMLVNAILKQHYDVKPEHGEKAMLRSIAKTIRALHVGHFFVDGNGRHNVFLLMNKLLVDAGFDPSILPHGPEVFGGIKTIDGLVKDIEDGMKAFKDLAGSDKKSGDEVKKKDQ